jgi:hypothetical protein
MDSGSLGGSRDNHLGFFSHKTSLTILFILDSNVKFRHIVREEVVRSERC